MEAVAGQRQSEEIVVRACCRVALEGRAAKECRRRFGDCAWQLSETAVCPCMVSLGGHVRLWEGRFRVQTAPAV
jgi:hypothetical protein